MTSYKEQIESIANSVETLSNEPELKLFKTGTCGNCEKNGDLFLLPLRLSVVGKDKTFKLPTLPTILESPLSTSDYAVQMMRKGYLYVLEDRKTGLRWRGFSISEEGCLHEAPPDKLPAKPHVFSCDITTHGVNASCISFERSREINGIYFLFSPDRVTQSRLDYYQQQGRAELTFYVPQQANVGPVSIIKPSQLWSQVVEFDLIDRLNNIQKQASSPNKGIASASLLINYKRLSLYHMDNMDQSHARYSGLVNTLEKHNGIAIVLNDAIGITQSLTNWRNGGLEHELKAWMEKKDWQGVTNERRHLVAQELKTLKSAFHARRVQTMQRKEEASFRSMLDDEYSIGGGDESWKDDIAQTHSETISKRYREEYTPEVALAEFNKKYWSRLDNQKFEQFEAELTKKETDAQAKMLARTDDVLTWLQSPLLIKHLNCYDRNDIAQGILFSHQIGLMLFGITSDLRGRELLDRWWDASTIDDKNLCWRGYAYNQTVAINEIERCRSKYSAAPLEYETHIDQSRSAVPQLAWIKELAGFFDQVNSFALEMERAGLPIMMATNTFTDLGRCLLRSPNINALEKGFHWFFRDMVVAGLGRYAHEINVAAQIESGVAEISQSTAKRSAGQVQWRTQRRLDSALMDVHKSDFYRVRLSGGLAVLEAFALLHRGLAFKGEGREYAELLSNAFMLSSVSFQIYASYIENAATQTMRTSLSSVQVYSGAFTFWGGVLAAGAGSIFAGLDYVDMQEARSLNNTTTSIGYFIRTIGVIMINASQFSIALNTAAPWLQIVSQRKETWRAIASSAGRLAAVGRSVNLQLLVRLNIWLTVGIIVVSVLIALFDNDALEKWFARCCFSNNDNRNAYKDVGEELTALSQAIIEVV